VGIKREKDFIVPVGQLFQDIRIPIIGLGFKVTSKGNFRIDLENGKIIFTVVVHQKWNIVTENLCEKTYQK